VTLWVMICGMKELSWKKAFVPPSTRGTTPIVTYGSTKASPIDPPYHVWISGFLSRMCHNQPEHRLDVGSSLLFYWPIRCPSSQSELSSYSPYSLVRYTGTRHHWILWRILGSLANQYAALRTTLQPFLATE
jgi:hypothetical protein